MDFSDLPKFIQNFLNEIIAEENFGDYSMKIKSGAEPGDGFSCELISVIILENSSDKRLDILCKIAPFDEIQRKDFLSHMLFSREALFYNELMPIFAKFQNEKNLPKNDQFLSIPKCYKTLSDDVQGLYAILMEDLRPQGFRMCNKFQTLPIDNLRLVMRELGKFHGLSVAMKHQKPNEFAQFKQVTDICKIFTQSANMEQTFNKFFDRAVKSLNNEMHKDIMRDIKVNFQAHFDYCLRNETTNRFGVLSHGNFLIFVVKQQKIDFFDISNYFIRRRSKQ